MMAAYWTKVQYRIYGLGSNMMLMGNKSTWIAVVDHDAHTRQAMVSLLRSMEFDAMSFSAGSLFIESLRLRKPDCIVLDLHMPYMSGFMVMSRLQEYAKKIPVIVLTKLELSEDFKRTCLLDAIAVLQKPVSDQVLRATIEGALHQKSAGSAPGPMSAI